MRLLVFSISNLLTVKHYQIYYVLVYYTKFNNLDLNSQAQSPVVLLSRNRFSTNQVSLLFLYPICLCETHLE